MVITGQASTWMSNFDLESFPPRAWKMSVSSEEPPYAVEHMRMLAPPFFTSVSQIEAMAGSPAANVTGLAAVSTSVPLMV